MCVSGDVEQVEPAEKITVKVFKSITLVHEAGMVLLEVRVTSCFLCLQKKKRRRRF